MGSAIMECNNIGEAEFLLSNKRRLGHHSQNAAASFQCRFGFAAGDGSRSKSPCVKLHSSKSNLPFIFPKLRPVIRITGGAMVHWDCSQAA
jgi:hypothetical protein